MAKKVGVRCPRYREIGHSVGDLIWWDDDKGIIQWQVFDGKAHHHDISGLDMDARWRGRLDMRSFTASLLPPVALYASLDAQNIIARLPLGSMLTLEHLGAKRFWMDSTKGMVRLIKRHKKVSMTKERKDE